MTATASGLHREIRGEAARPTLRSLHLPAIGPWLLVGAPMLFNAWGLWAEVMPIQNPNDSALHLSMVQWARGRIDAGQIPLDGWFPYLGIGSAQFHHYQTLPHVVSAYVSLLFGTTTTYLWSLYLLLALWPLSMYLGARLMGWDRWVAAGAAVMSPLLVSASGYGFEVSSYVWQGYGLWPQLWGMWLMPLALGFGWRAIEGKPTAAAAALTGGLTIACHFIAGYLVLIAFGVFSLVSVKQLPVRIARAALVGGGALVAAAWVIVPLLSDARWIPASEFGRGTFYADSFGAVQILRWLFSGQLYDNGRFPIISLLVATGIVVCTTRLRSDARARAALAIWLVSLILFFGPRTLGPSVKLVPMLSLVPLHRMIMGVHFAGLIMAGVGTASVGRWLVSLGRRVIPEVRPTIQICVVAGLGLLILAPAWKQIASYDHGGADLKRAQLASETSDGADLRVLAERIKALGPGRLYAGSRANWGSQYDIGYIPVYSVLEGLNLDVVGYTLRVSSLMTDPEAYFDEHNLAQYDLLNIRYIVLPSDHSPPVKAVPLARQGRHTLWQVDTSGYLEVVDAIGPPLTANRGNVGSQALGFMESADLAGKRYHWVAYEGSAAAAPTLSPEAASDVLAGSVQTENDSPADGSFTAAVQANRPAVVLLKESYDPHWVASVDGSIVQPDMIAPALVGVPVAAGHHTVTFRYRPYPFYAELVALGILVILGLWIVPWRVRREETPEL